eukprot:TRINITY_DN5923_c0_g1_i5.p1 TRINITY_DN5923_c0_g1~~TRINITY_DN5923_c0_g1_i5.p1  ORF type:complete len:164 (-),score=25.34 TRINITY_DN5923_c0_g1_i5:115-606(-)
MDRGRFGSFYNNEDKRIPGQTKNLSHTGSFEQNDYKEDMFTEVSPVKQIGSNLNQTAGIQGTVSEDELQIMRILSTLRERLHEIDSKLDDAEREKGVLIEDIGVLTQRLKVLNKNALRKKELYEAYDRTCRETESAFSKIVESSKTLLNVVKQERNSLYKATK